MKLRSIVESKSGSQNSGYWEEISVKMEEKSASQCRHRWKSLSTKKKSPTETTPILSTDAVIAMN